MKRIMPRRSRGATLVEALVAMAVMAFGMLALVGVQQTLRVNSDLSKQRNEATRLAEREIETVRADAGSGEAQFDAIPIGPAAAITVTGDNATFTVERTVSQAADNATADNRGLMTHVVVWWRDRTGERREVAMHDMLARVDPTLTGLVRAEKPLTAVGRRNSRHPTIPGRAHDLGDGKSIFKPVEGNSTVAWVFNNSTGIITHYCTVSSSSTSASLTSISGCTATQAQLLAGEIRFNLRGGTLDLGSESVIKPVASGQVAWVIDNTSKNITRLCPVPAATPTASLTSAMVSSGCTTVTPIAIAPFESTDATYTLVASDSENPKWLSVPATVDIDGSAPVEGVSSMACYSNAEAASSAPTIPTTVQRSIEYFCMVTPLQIVDGWGARTKVVPVPFSDGGAVWTTGNVAGTYRVCRYTTASSGYTTNVDHPNIYGKESPSCGSTCPKVKGNLINQNFLIIDGTKACPTDVAADPAAGDLVNSNTLQHQP